MRIGIAATVGGLKPVALVGLLRALDDIGHLQDVVAYSGSSGGSIWCALAAAGYPPTYLWDLALSIDSPTLWEDWDVHNLLTAVARSATNKKVLAGFTGLMDGDKVLAWLQFHLGSRTFEDLPTPCYITAYNINEERKLVFGPGMTPLPVQVASAVRGSIAIPLGFRHMPIRIADTPDGNCGFWDGGVTSILPLRPLVEFEHVDMILALDATGATDPAGEPWRSIDYMGITDMLEGAIKALAHEASDTVLAEAKALCPNTHVMQISVGASMGNPKDTIRPALDASYRDGAKFLQEVFQYGG